MGNTPAENGKMVSILITKARKAPSVELVSGRMKSLLVIVITEEKVNFTLEHGRVVLPDLLYEKGDGQVSDLDQSR